MFMKFKRYVLSTDEFLPQSYALQVNTAEPPAGTAGEEDT